MSTTSKPRLQNEWLDKRAVTVVDKLQKAKYETYLVGGCVRDLLSGFHPKDYDIATYAKPNEVKKLVPGSYVIGRRFRLVLVKRGGDQFEVATFRRDANDGEVTDDEHPQADNLFGSPEEDAKRRDFTVNALFYDPIKDDIIDYVDGMKDIEERVIRVIGDPHERLKEDPIRILRALRLANKLHFTIEPKLRQAMIDCAEEIPKSVLPRRREELLKILRLKDPGLVLQEAHDLGILKHCWPCLDSVYDHPNKHEIFRTYLSRMGDWIIDASVPTEPLALLTLALLASEEDYDPSEKLHAGEISNNDQIKSPLKEELGMFLAEITEIGQALEIVTRLQPTETYQRRGARRRQSFVRQPGFRLALRIAEFEHHLSPEDLQFWKNHIISR